MKKILSIILTVTMMLTMVVGANVFADTVVGDAVVGVTATGDSTATIYADDNGDWSTNVGVFIIPQGGGGYSDIGKSGTDGTVDGNISADNGVRLSTQKWELKAYNTEFTLSASGNITTDTTYKITFATSENGFQYNGNNLTYKSDIFITVKAKITPTVTTWPTATTINYGQTLENSILSGGIASIPGNFVFTNPTIAPSAGTQGYSVTFMPIETTKYKSVNGMVNVTVNKVNPTGIIWPTGTLTYGQKLSEATLSSGSTNGSFSFVNPDLIPEAGTASQNFDATFIPTDKINYNSVTGTINVTVNKANPTGITWPTGIMTYGQKLSEATLSGGIGNGSFSFVNPDFKPNVGTQTYEVIFTPTDSSNYNTLTKTISVIVNKANPTGIIWPTGTMTYGQKLSEATLSGGSGNGSFSFVNPDFKPNAGAQTYEAIFTPTDSANYNTVTKTINVTVNKADPIVKWPVGTMTYGQKLSEATLSNGTGNGSFSFTNSDFKPNAGTAAQSFDATFIPTDKDNYNTLTGTINVTVNKANPTGVVWPTGTMTYGQKLSEASLNGGTGNGSFSFANPDFKPNAGTAAQSFDATFTPADKDNYNTLTGTINVTVNKANPIGVIWPTGMMTYGQKLSQATLSGGSTNGSFAFISPDTVPNAGSEAQTFAAVFTPSDNENYNTLTGNITVTVNKAALTVTVNDANKVYGATLPTFGVSYNGFVLSDTPASLSGELTYTTTATQASVTGTYPITAVGLTSNNYEIAFRPGTLTINPAILTITAKNATKYYLDPLPTFDVTYDGFVLGQDKTVLNGVLNFNTDASILSNVGTYLVTPSGLTSANYAITFNAGTLTIIYNFLGIQQPINYPADTPTDKNMSVFKAGSTIPLKFKIDKKVIDATATIQYSIITTNTSGIVINETDPALVTATGGTTFRYDSTSDQYIYNWSTKQLKAGIYKLIITLNDGQKYYVYLGLK